MTSHLTKDDFLNKVFNFEQNQDWKFEGDLPCIIDFYADWCQPCKMVAPVLEELSEEYEGKAVVTKLDVDSNPGISAKYGIRNIPTILFFKNGEIVDKQVGPFRRVI